MEEVRIILEGSESEDEEVRQSVRNVLYVPPEADALTDDENINDEIVNGEDIDAMDEVAGNIEIEYSNADEDIAAPSSSLSSSCSCAKEVRLSKKTIPPSKWKKTKFPRYSSSRHDITGLQAHMEW